MFQNTLNKAKNLASGALAFAAAAIASASAIMITSPAVAATPPADPSPTPSADVQALRLTPRDYAAVNKPGAPDPSVLTAGVLPPSSEVISAKELVEVGSSVPQPTYPVTVAVHDNLAGNNFANPLPPIIETISANTGLFSVIYTNGSGSLPPEIGRIVPSGYEHTLPFTASTTVTLPPAGKAVPVASGSIQLSPDAAKIAASYGVDPANIANLAAHYGGALSLGSGAPVPVVVTPEPSTTTITVPGRVSVGSQQCLDVGARLVTIGGSDASLTVGAQANGCVQPVEVRTATWNRSGLLPTANAGLDVQFGKSFLNGATFVIGGKVGQSLIPAGVLPAQNNNPPWTINGGITTGGLSIHGSCSNGAGPDLRSLMQSRAPTGVTIAGLPNHNDDISCGGGVSVTTGNTTLGVSVTPSRGVFGDSTIYASFNSRFRGL